MYSAKSNDIFTLKACSRRSYPEQLRTVLSVPLDNIPASTGKLEPKTHHEFRHWPKKGPVLIPRAINTQTFIKQKLNYLETPAQCSYL